MKVRAWVRAEDWTNLLAGIYMALVPVMFTTVTAASANAYTLGPVIGVLALAALAFPRARWIEWTQLLAAVWLFVAPWALGFSGVSGAAWNAWIIGALVAAFAVTRIFELGSASVRPAGKHLPHTP